jgi:hypothetical protein
VGPHPLRPLALLVAALTIAGAGLSACSDETKPAPSPLVLTALHAEADPVRGGRIVDGRGREVLLRGVNVNALAEYWKGAGFATTFPLAPDDPARMRSIGWDAVRLLASWSRVEPTPGRYDEHYLDHVARTVSRLLRAGLYSIIDFIRARGARRRPPGPASGASHPPSPGSVGTEPRRGRRSTVTYRAAPLERDVRVTVRGLDAPSPARAGRWPADLGPHTRWRVVDQGGAPQRAVIAA